MKQKNCMICFDLFQCTNVQTKSQNLALKPVGQNIRFVQAKGGFLEKSRVCNERKRIILHICCGGFCLYDSEVEQKELQLSNFNS